MKRNLKISIPARELLTLVTPDLLFRQFMKQQEHAIARGRIQRNVSKRKLRNLAVACHAEFRKNLKSCSTQHDIAALNQALLHHIKPTRTDFLLAVWKGTKKETLESLQ